MNLHRLIRSNSKLFRLFFLFLCICFVYKLIKAPDEETNDVGINVENEEIPKEKHRSMRVHFGTGTLKERIILAQDYLLAQVQPNGQFVYKVNIQPLVRIKPDYNLLRHAGTIYSLAVIAEEFPSSKLNETIVKTGKWLKEQAETMDSNHLNIKPLWSKKPEVDGTEAEAKLGGAGLGLVALVAASEVNATFISTNELESVARFIEFMQKPTGEFNGKYNKVSGMSDFVSLYYPGEASLGLMKLYQKTKNQKWFEIALKGLKFLADLRQNQKTSDVLPDHWALISTREILKAPVLLQSDKRLLIRHAQKVATHLIMEQIHSTNKPKIQWSFDSRGGLAPACTRLEGLIAVMGSLSFEEQPINLKECIENGIQFVLSNQELAGPYKGGFRRQTVSDKRGHDTEIRIDYVQHCVTALVKYYQLIKNMAAENVENDS